MAADMEEDCLAAWAGGISEEERIHHELLFFSQGPADGYLTGERARDLFLHSRLPLPVLSKIWNLADISNDNLLSVEEFVLTMHLILKVKEGVTLPKSLPKHLVPVVLPSPPLPDMSQQEREAYRTVFQKFDIEKKSHFDAIEGRELMLESGLSPVELCRIWDLCDVDKNGSLDEEEWALACHLIRALKQGESLAGPVNVFQYIPDRISPVSYHARKKRVDDYCRNKHQLMSLKEKRKTQINSESRRLELLKKRFALHKELYDFVTKTEGEPKIPEEEFQLYKEKEETNIEKVEEIVYRLKKEHERVRQQTVKIILGEQGSLQEDQRLIKQEIDEVRHILATSHTKATKDPDPFHQLYEQRKEARKKSTLSEGEEPEIYHPFKISPFDKETLSIPISGQNIFLDPDPALQNNNNKHNHKGRELLEKLQHFDEGFIEQWSSGVAKDTDEDLDLIFMSLKVPMEKRVWSGLAWSGDGQASTDKLVDLHQKLVDLKLEMEKLNEDTDGQLLFRNPEDYLARKKAKEEEERLEKSKYQRRFHSDKKTAAPDRERISKRRSYAPVPDNDAQKSAREEYRQKRRSLNLDAKGHEAYAAGVNPKQRDRPRQRPDVEKTEVGVKTKTDNSATSPGTSPRVSSPESQTSPIHSPRKKKAAPPPPTPPTGSPPVSPTTASPTKIPQPTDTPEKPSRPPRRKRIGSKENDSFLHRSFEKEQEQAPKEKKTSTHDIEKVEIESQKTVIEITPSAVSESKPVEVTLETPSSGPVEQSKPDITPSPDSPQVSEPVPVKTDLEVSVSAPTEQSTVPVSVSPEQSQVPVSVSPEQSQVPVSVSPEQGQPAVEVEVSMSLPQSDIDSFILDSESPRVNGEAGESLLDTIVKEFPDLQKKEQTQVNTENSDFDVIVPVVKPKVKPQISFDKWNGVADEKFHSEVISIEQALAPAVIEETQTVRPDSPVEITVEVSGTKDTEVLVEDDLDEPDAYLDHIQPAAYKRTDDLDQVFRKISSFPDKEKIKEHSDTSSDTGSDIPPLPETLPPALGRSSSLTEVSEAVEAAETAPIEASVSLSVDSKMESVEPTIDDVAAETQMADVETVTVREETMSPIADLKASLFSMRVTSPTHGMETNGVMDMSDLKIDVKSEDSDVSGDDEGQPEMTGTFSPGNTENKMVPTEMNEDDDGGIQLISYSAKLNSPNSDHSQPDSAFEDMQSSMTSNDPLSNTLDDIAQEEFMVTDKVEMQQSTPKSKQEPLRKFELIMDDTPKPVKHGPLSPTAGSNFMEKAKMFADAVQKPPKMHVTLRREVMSPDDLSDERYMELEKERRAVLSSSKMRKCDIDRTQFTEEMNDQDTQERAVSPEPEKTAREWQTDISTRNSIDWAEKPDKVNLYSENIIQESENTESVDRESIANLSTTRKQWENITKPKDTSPATKPQPGQVRHWEVKLPTLRKVPAKPIVRPDSESEEEGSPTMADTDYANESAIEREIRLATEREEMLRKEKEERVAAQAAVKVTVQNDDMESAEQNNNDKPTYREMTEADRGSELSQRETQIQLELEEQRERELELKLDSSQPQESSEESSAEDDAANESIIEREIRIQREREAELSKRNRPTESLPSPDEPESDEQSEPVEETYEEEVVDIVETVPTPTSESTLSTPDNLSDVDTPPAVVKQRVSYEEAIANSHHTGESLIARELREAREREEELAEQRQRVGGSVKSPAPKQQAAVSKPSEPVVNKAGTYQKDVSPFKQNTRRQSQDSLSSHSTGKSPSEHLPLKNVTVSFEPRLLYNKPPVKEEKDKSKKVKKPETPIEREIRLARERENELRAQKGLPLLVDEKKEESSESEEEELTPRRQVMHNTKSSAERTHSLQNFASNKLQQEIKRQSELEKKYRDEGKIITTSEDHVDIVRYSELPTVETKSPVKRNFNIPKKNVPESPREPAPQQNGTVEKSKASASAPAPTPETQKYKRSVSGGSVSFSYRESRHKAESKIEQELREMREREEELRTQRAHAGIASPDGPESPRSPGSNSVENKRSQFEQTT